MKNPVVGFIYGIFCSETEKFYVGSARCRHRRKSAHWGMLRRNKHHCIYLQRVFNQHGEKTFSFKILETVDDMNFLRAREQAWISRHQGQLYNLSLNAFHPEHVKHMTADQKEKLRIRLRGNTYRKNKTVSSAARENISRGLLGNKRRLGIPHSPEMKKQISNSLKKLFLEGKRIYKAPTNVRRNNKGQWEKII